MKKQVYEKSNILLFLPPKYDTNSLNKLDKIIKDRIKKSGKKISEFKEIKNYIFSSSEIKFSFKVNDKKFSIEIIHRKEINTIPLLSQTVSDKNKELSKFSQLIAIVSTDIKSDPMQNYLKQINLIYNLFPDSVIFYDMNKLSNISIEKMKYMTSLKTFLGADLFYTIHNVVDKKRIWMHTHGLTRCGLPELELLNVKKEYYYNAKSIIDYAVNYLLVTDSSINNVLTLGNGVTVKLQDWENALKLYPEDTVGTTSLDRKNAHSFNNKILTFPNEVQKEDLNFLQSLFSSTKIVDNTNEILKDMGNDPLLFLSSEETVRMSNLAKETWDWFKKLYEKKKDKGWKFLVKLGFSIDNAENTNDKEHLWFSVIDLEDSNVKVKLMNTPYGINRMKKDDIDTYKTDKLTDWLIIKEEKKFSPNNLYLLMKDDLPEELDQ